MDYQTESEYLKLIDDYNDQKKAIEILVNELAVLRHWKANSLQMINDSLLDCKDAIKDYELSEEGADLINQGWIEAQEFVLSILEDQTPKKEG